jgi:ABC-2 type transport system permease protein
MRHGRKFMIVTLAFLRKEMLLLRRNPSVFVFLFIIPLFLATILSHPFSELNDDKGADHTIPGFTLMFGFYIVMFMTSAHFHEHGWGSWTLVRVSGLSRVAMGFGIALPYFILSVVQMLIMLTAGTLIFGSSLNGSIVGLILLVVAIAATWTAIALFLLNVTSHMTTVMNLSNLVALSLASLGGALVPRENMPGWSQPLARLTPHFWAVEGLKGVGSRGQELLDVLPNLLGLAVFAATVFLIAMLRFDPAKRRNLPV